MKKDNLKDKPLSQMKVIEIGSLSEVPADLIARYLRDRAIELMFVEILGSKYFKKGMDFMRISLYRSGDLERTFKYGANWGLLLRFSLFRRGLFYLLCLPLILICWLRVRSRFDILIAVNSPFPLIGLVLRPIRLVNKVVFISGDHLPAPEKKNVEAIFTAFYRLTDRLAQNASNAVWYLSPKTMDAKEKDGFLKNSSVHRQVVPIAINTERNRGKANLQIERASIGYVGEVSERMGLLLAIEAVNEVKKDVPEVKLKIIGSGVFQDTLKAKIRELGLEENVELLGFIGDKDKVMDIISSCAISIALYAPIKTQPIQFTDPAKVKEYLECGTPVITTKLTEIAFEIDENKAGFAVEYDRYEVAEAMTRLLTDDELWEKYIGNVRLLATKYDYRTLYDKAFSTL